MTRFSLDRREAAYETPEYSMKTRAARSWTDALFGAPGFIFWIGRANLPPHHSCGQKI